MSLAPTYGRVSPEGHGRDNQFGTPTGSARTPGWPASPRPSAEARYRIESASACSRNHDGRRAPRHGATAAPRHRPRQRIAARPAAAATSFRVRVGGCRVCRTTPASTTTTRAVSAQQVGDDPYPRLGCPTFRAARVHGAPLAIARSLRRGSGPRDTRLAAGERDAAGPGGT